MIPSLYQERDMPFGLIDGLAPNHNWEVDVPAPVSVVSTLLIEQDFGCVYLISLQNKAKICPFIVTMPTGCGEPVQQCSVLLLAKYVTGD
jgi:hypothetical protein